jgi:hypothetical protein
MREPLWKCSIYDSYLHGCWVCWICRFAIVFCLVGLLVL